MPLLNANAPILVVDLEATCWGDQLTPSGSPQGVTNMEIIEIGCALATRTGELLMEKSLIIQPSQHPRLSNFCTSLTGITQAMVDRASPFSEAVPELDIWLGQLPEHFMWCSWGNYDRLHIQAESQKHGGAPAFLKLPHLNLKRIWRRTTGQKKKNGLANALAFHKLEFDGTPHRGVDDARNIVRLLPFMDWSLEAELLTPPPI